MVKKTKSRRCLREAAGLQLYAIQPAGFETHIFVVEAAGVVEAVKRAIIVEPLVTGLSTADRTGEWQVTEHACPVVSLPLYLDGYFRMLTDSQKGTGNCGQK